LRRCSSDKQTSKNVIRLVPGFVAYFLIKAGKGGASVTVCENKTGADASIQRAAEWIRRNERYPPASGSAIAAGFCAAGGCANSAAPAASNVQQELRLAMQYRKPILPLRLAETDFPEGVEYILAARQYVDLLDLKQEQWLPEVLRALALLADEPVT